MSFKAGCAAATVAFGLSATTITAQAADFSGERIELIIPFSEGGGTDTWGRFWAPYFTTFLPGNPTVVVRNIPGGGSTTGANQFEARAQPDGLTAIGTSGSTQFPYLLQDKRVNFEMRDWRVVLASPTGGVVYVNADLGVESAENMGNLSDVKLVYGSQGATSLDLVPLLAFELLGWDVDAVFGMQGRGAGRLAFERGEVNIDYQTSSAYINNVTPLVTIGTAVPLFSWGAMDDDGNIIRDPSFPDLPSFPEAYEMMKGEKPSGPAWEAYKAFFIAGFPAQKLVFLPKGTPDDIVEAFRTAAQTATEDASFIEDRQAALGEYKQIVGDPAERIFRQAVSVPDDARVWVQNWLTEKYSVQF
ncbi:tripartite tricarboxylate transporter substrate binding protein [Thalassospira sp.]|uniref:Bug family tripartite tricarboxylate transporter substrate binding protein n=1 Tax=Thalassospira sp. TaxID=1912094 RepID=UPI0027356A0F|nr:tripartite tricarboxylate transporter substrate-binding protein [Thalassospira sp.]MDP2699145.1 tripartite tricarboxylate transporter substrate-binding protein [Thalassospira sp.]